MKLNQDIQTINETITSINNLEYGTEHHAGVGTMSNKKNSKKQKISNMEDFLKSNSVRQVHPWLWQLISITLGVDPQRRENPGVVSCILELMTVGSAISNFIKIIAIIQINVLNSSTISRIEHFYSIIL